VKTQIAKAWATSRRVGQAGFSGRTDREWRKRIPRAWCASRNPCRAGRGAACSRSRTGCSHGPRAAPHVLTARTARGHLFSAAGRPHGPPFERYGFGFLTNSVWDRSATSFGGLVMIYDFDGSSRASAYTLSIARDVESRVAAMTLLMATRKLVDRRPEHDRRRGTYMRRGSPGSAIDTCSLPCIRSVTSRGRL